MLAGAEELSMSLDPPVEILPAPIQPLAPSSPSFVINPKRPPVELKVSLPSFTSITTERIH